jgi:hypothetical protein
VIFIRPSAFTDRYYYPGLLHDSGLQGTVTWRNFVRRQERYLPYVALTRANVRYVTNRDCGTGMAPKGDGGRRSCERIPKPNCFVLSTGSQYQAAVQGGAERHRADTPAVAS